MWHGGVGEDERLFCLKAAQAELDELWLALQDLRELGVAANRRSEGF